MRIDIAAINDDVAAIDIVAAADAGRTILALNIKAAIAADCQRLAIRDVDAGIPVAKSFDAPTIVSAKCPLKNKRGVAKAGEPRPFALKLTFFAIVVDVHISERHRRAVGDGNLVGSAEYSVQGHPVLCNEVAVEQRKVDTLVVDGARRFGRAIYEGRGHAYRAAGSARALAYRVVAVRAARGHDAGGFGIDADHAAERARSTADAGRVHSADGRYVPAVDRHFAAVDSAASADARAAAVAGRR